MSTNALFFAWNRSIPGRERMSDAHFQEFVQYLTQLQQNGAIKSFDTVFLDPHGGDLNGFILVHGEVEKLNMIREEDEFLKLVTQCTMCVENFGVINGWAGKKLEEQMKRWRSYIK